MLVEQLYTDTAESVRGMISSNIRRFSRIFHLFLECDNCCTFI
jgi:hypothetical protein